MFKLSTSVFIYWFYFTGIISSVLVIRIGSLGLDYCYLNVFMNEYILLSKLDCPYIYTLYVSIHSQQVLGNVKL